MKPLNTLPLEDFLEKARIAIKGNQKTVTLSIKEVTDLQNSISTIMTRLAGDMDQLLTNNPAPTSVEVKMDGGRF